MNTLRSPFLLSSLSIFARVRAVRHFVLLFPIAYSLFPALTGCSLLSYTSSRNEIRIVSYSLDGQGNMRPDEVTVVSGIMSDGTADYEQIKLYEPSAQGDARIKVADYVNIRRRDNSKSARDISLAKAQGTADVSATAADAITDAIAAYASSGITTLPQILAALKDTRHAATQGTKVTEESEDPQGTESTASTQDHSTSETQNPKP